MSDGDAPLLVPDHHGAATGILIDDLTTDDAARLAYYEEPFGYVVLELTVSGAKAKLYLPQARRSAPLDPWDYVEWMAGDAPRTIDAAREYMAAFPHIPAVEAARHYPMIVQRAASRLRAKSEVAPDQVRRGVGHVAVAASRLPYLGYFAVQEADLQFERFDGEISPSVSRTGFLMGDAVTVLPYDPVRDRVLVVEQFRYGAFLRGDPNPWTLEPIAGRVDHDETPEDAARREAVEEAGLSLGRMILIARYYPSPGAISEYLYSYVALCDLPDSAAGIGGLVDEAEDIKAHILSFDALMALVATPEASNGPLILTAHALAGLRSSLVP